MEKRTVIDEAGVWFISKAAYPMQDGATKAVFLPGVPTKVAKTAWIALQSSWLVPWQDPDLAVKAAKTK